MRPRPEQPIHTDPVCRMKLSRHTAAEEVTYRGRTYYFCAPICREAFEAEPQKYLRPHRQHGVKPS